MFQPPDDAGSSPRLFDRLLWGHRSLWVRSGPSYTADEKRYSGGRYRPRQTNDLTARSGHIIGDFIKAARGRELNVYFQLSASGPARRGYSPPARRPYSGRSHDGDSKPSQ